MQALLNASLVLRARQARVIPVLTITDVAHAVPLARALVAGGLTLLEITLRTPVALEVIQRIVGEVPQAEVGAGTVLNAKLATTAMTAGAQFLVSPGATQRLLDSADGWSVPLLPGVATASEAMALMDRGLRFMKFFPAENVGGIPALKALSAPLADALFCPTGGVGPNNFGAYLACSNVVCVGGSWVAPQALVDAGRWAEITALATAAHHSAAHQSAKGTP